MRDNRESVHYIGTVSLYTLADNPCFQLRTQSIKSKQNYAFMNTSKSKHQFAKVLIFCYK